MENLFVSWREFLNGKSKRQDVILFGVNLMDNIYSLHNDLKNKTYKHSNYEVFKINDPKPRDIHKAIVRDRLLHHAIYRILYPYFDKKFIHDSYSCRIGKGTHKAIYRFESFINRVSKNNTKTCWVLKCDIRKFFANIDHDILKSILAKHIQDKDTLNILENIIDSFSSNPIGKAYGVNNSPLLAIAKTDECAKSNFAQNKKLTNSAIAENVNNEKGLPLGNLTSQLLVNIYMNEFDQYMKHVLKVKYYIRYADDFVILSEDKKCLEDILKEVANFLKENLRLELHPDKVFIKTIYSGVDFLGWGHFPTHRVLRNATKKRMIRNLKNNSNENTRASYLGMLNHGNTFKLKENLDFLVKKR
ncbi:MAG: reverse transcriptase/maturase family protein [Candidatus Nomurabacteria bacterium]|nr:reverse transcriptase/maturase family protein [Candidatus Nomurabacteria bacterium]